MKYDSIVGGAKQRGQEFLQKLGYNKNPDDIDLMNDVDLDSIRDPLLIDKENSKIVTDKYTPCPCEGCKASIKEDTFTITTGKEESIEQGKSVGAAGTGLNESKGEVVLKGDTMEFSVARCVNPECKRHIRPGDKKEVARKKAAGERPYNKKETNYSKNIKKIEDQNESEKNQTTQSY